MSQSTRAGVANDLSGTCLGKQSCMKVSKEVWKRKGANPGSESSTTTDIESGTDTTSTDSSDDEGQANSCTLKGLISSRGLVFWLLIPVGLIVGIIALTQHLYWLLASASLLTGMASFSSIVLGGDIFQLHVLKESVGKLQKENKFLERQNDDLETKVAELGRVASGLADVERELGKDVEAVKDFVKELESFTSIQSVSAMLNLYFAADLNGSGHISGHEANVLFHGLTVVWDLVPELSPSKPGYARLVKAVQAQGLSFGRYALLVQAAAAGDAAGCRRELEAMARGLGEIHDHEVQASSGSEESAAEEEKEDLVPCFVLGPLRVWSKSHVVFIAASLVSAVLLVHSFLPFGVASFLCAAADLGLAGSLTAYGKLVVVSKALREELLRFQEENERLAASNQDLGEKVANLGKIQRGLKVLQEEFHGSATRAQSTIQRSNASVKMSAIAALTHLFAKADANSDGELSEHEVDEFAAGLELVFRHVENFDVEAIRQSLRQDGLRVEQVRALVDLILTAGGTSAPRGGAVGSRAMGGG